MISGPIAALRALPTRTLADLAQALRDGRLTGAATAFMVRYAVPAVGVTAAAELSSLLASGLGPQHAALLLDALAAELEPRGNSAVLELVTLTFRYARRSTTSFASSIVMASGSYRCHAKDFKNLAETLATLVTPCLHPACPRAAPQGVSP